MSGDNPKVALLWQHEYGSKWITYPEDKLDVINKALCKGQKSVTLPDKDPKKHIVCHFDKMFQKNKVSGWEQRLRCCVYDKGFYSWQWKEDDGYWSSYTAGISVELESCFKQGKNAKFFFRDDYEVNMKTFKQRNENTGTERDVKRERIFVDELPFIKTISEAFKVYSENKRKLDAAGSNETRVSKTLETTAGRSSRRAEVPVDKECTELAERAYVWSDESGVYDAVLNQTNLVYNNNKYYRMQVLKEYSKEKYYVWYRWGRVGCKGQSNLMPFHSSLVLAKEEFRKKFASKTSNQWEGRANFRKIPGKYDLLKIEYGKEEDTQKPIFTEELNISSRLPDRICVLLGKITDGNVFVKQAAEMKYDVNKNPLGKLNAEQVRAGWLALQKIDALLTKNASGSELVNACSEYYTRIPHDFGMRVPPVISSHSALLVEMRLLQVLSDAEVAFRIKEELKIVPGNPLDVMYESLKCTLVPLDQSDSMYQVIERYLLGTHGPTHISYRMEIADVFSCLKPEEEENFQDYGNKYLLWHGSRLTNFVGILKNGLQIAPPEAPATGYMFGKGLYFADVSSKSANYCHPTKKQNEGLVLLCEVSLGEENILYSANYDARADTKKQQKNSVKAMGKFVPDPEETIEISDVKIPLGKPIQVKDSEHHPEKYELNYNEYVVYNCNQVKLRYLINLRFIFTHE